MEPKISSSTSYVDERIDSFLNLFIKQLKEMPNETFQHHVSIDIEHSAN